MATVNTQPQFNSPITGTQQKKGSGGYQDLRKYLQANQKTNYGNQLGGQIQGQAQQLGQSVGQARTDIQGQVNPELQRLNQAGQTISGAVADPNATANNQQQLDAFNKLRTGDYLKNVQAQNQQQINAQQQNVANQAQLTGTESGRFQLLRNMFAPKTANYSRGAGKLDQLLLQGQGGQLKNLQNQAQAANTQAQNTVGQLNKDVAGYNQQIQQLGTQAQQQANEALTGNISSLQQGLEQKAQQETAQRQTQVNSLKEALKNGQLTQEQAQQLGVQGNLDLYGVDPTQFLNASSGPLTAQNVASQADAAKMNALYKLGGQSELVGSFNAQQANPAFQFNQDALKNAIATQKGAYEQQINPLQQQTSQAQQDLVKSAEALLNRAGGAQGPVGGEAHKWKEYKQNLENIKAGNYGRAEWLAGRDPNTLNNEDKLLVDAYKRYQQAQRGINQANDIYGLNKKLAIAQPETASVNPVKQNYPNLMSLF